MLIEHMFDCQGARSSIFWGSGMGQEAAFGLLGDAALTHKEADAI